MKAFRNTFLIVFVLSGAGLLAACKSKEQVNISAITQALKNQDKDARVNACVELAKVGPKAASAVPDLIPLLKDKDAEVRRLAAYALMEIGPGAKAAIPALKELMSDLDRVTALQAINSLRAIDPAAADLKPPPNVTQ